MALTACFVSASRQNVFFAELLDALADALADHGIAVERSVDCFPPLGGQTAYVFVPHELLPLLMPDAHPDPQQLRRSVVICTEQPGTHWFQETAKVAQRAGAVIDINRLGAASLRKLGVDARFLQLGYTPRWDRWHGLEGRQRPIDVTLLAGATPRRLQAIARCGHHLAGRRTELHLPEALVPHRADSGQFISGARKWELLSQSRLLINVHRGELGYFEWQRATEAICNGCVLLSEHSLGAEPLVPGDHFASVSFDSLDVALEALLQDESRLARMRASAYELLRRHHPLSRSASVLVEAVTRAAAAPLPSQHGRRAAVPRPQPPRLPPPAWEGAQVDDELGFVRRAVTRLLIEQEDLRASLGTLRPASDTNRKPGRVEHLGIARSTSPRLSVVLTVTGDPASVARSIDHLAASEMSDYEVVIVDDTSSIGSGNRLRAALAQAPWLASTLLTLEPHSSLAQARNRGVELAVGELVLVMDARHAPYPHALGHLADALDRNRSAVFSYGIVEQDGHSGPIGATGYLGWDTTMLRYGDFVGGMAMVRRRALLEVGGYATDRALRGWEGLALWCAFADRGWIGTRVPEIVARQRVGLMPPSAEASDAWNLLRERFMCLSASVAA
jgi:Glycosyl transferase family 2